MSDTQTDAAHAVPSDTTPTWEMELLVSGATVFGLMQLPQLVDHAAMKVMNLGPQDYVQLSAPLWIYSKVAIIFLIVTFVVHLCLRGYWVALVGMNSVYPGGIRWQNLRMGSIGRSVGEREAPPMSATIERADNRATRVFAVGFGFAMLMLRLAVAMLFLLGCCVAFDTLFGRGHAMQVFGTVLAIAAVPLSAAAIADRAVGARLQGGGGVHRAIAAVLRFYSHFGFGQRSNPLLALFVSHEGRHRAAAVFLGILLPIMGLIYLQDSILKGRLPLGTYVGLSTDDPYSSTSSQNAFYADSASGGSRALPLPRIPGRVASGAWLPLFVPFVPRLHGPALQAACPQALARIASQLACLGKLSDIRIDGVVKAVELQASTDPQSGQPGMVAMLPIGSLAAGRHELSLSEPARDSLDPAKRFRRYRIAFWK